VRMADWACATFPKRRPQLSLVACARHVPCGGCSAFVAAGVDVDATNECGETAAHTAAWLGHAHALRVLIAAGAPFPHTHTHTQAVHDRSPCILSSTAPRPIWHTAAATDRVDRLQKPCLLHSWLMCLPAATTVCGDDYGCERVQHLSIRPRRRPRSSINICAADIL
jgi:hypothetical protein